MRNLLIILTIVLLVGCDQDAIIRDGQSEYSIYVDADADSLVLSVAEQLSAYLLNSTGAKLQIRNEPGNSYIRILVDESIDPASVAYRMDHSNLIISGGSARSALNATYRFLEQELGVRFYAPDYEYVPQLKDFLSNLIYQ